MGPFVLDVHTHTVASGHAYGTVMEMAKAASDAGLELLAITDHAPKMPGSCHEFHFVNFKAIDKELYGVKILMGAELNIMDFKGSVDLPERMLKKLAVCVASLHSVCIKPGTKKENTAAILGAIENPHVNIIGHPDDGHFDIDYEEMVLHAKDAGVLIELNNSSLMPGTSRVNTHENLLKILALCEKHGQRIVVNTDAHFPTAVGRFDKARLILDEAQFPEELVVNTSVDRFLSCLER